MHNRGEVKIKIAINKNLIKLIFKCSNKFIKGEIF